MNWPLFLPIFFGIIIGGLAWDALRAAADWLWRLGHRRGWW